jgi:hypothetical protein
VNLGLNLGFAPSRRRLGYLQKPVSPDLSNLVLWLDSESNVYSIVGNNFTNENVPIDLTGFPETFSTDVNGNYPVAGTTNGRNSYFANLSAEFGGFATVSWTGTQWQLYIEVNVEGDLPNTTSYLATGNTTYPWQATWANGTVTRPPTTFTTLANPNDTVALWGNKINGYPSMSQDSLSFQPLFINGTAIRFESDFFTATADFPQTWGSNWSYYVVSTPMTNISQSGTVPKYILAHSGASDYRGAFGVTNGSLAVRNNNSILFTAPIVTSGRIERPSPALSVFSARVNTSGFTLGFNFTFRQRTVAINSSDGSSLTLGALESSPNDAIVTGSVQEVLVYRETHNDTQANSILNYLIKRWGISL